MKRVIYNSYLKPFIKKINSFVKNKNVQKKIPPEYYHFDQSFKSNLVIFDDFLPNLLGSWRAPEISSYLRKFDKVELVCFLNFYDRNNKEQFEKDKQLFIEKYNLQSKATSISKIDSAFPININSKLAYCLFYHNLKRIFPILQKYNIPFLFTLYPGGGFGFYDKECDSFLKEIASSPLLKGIIVTQQCTYDYLIDRGIFQKDMLHLIYGACFPVKNYQVRKNKEYYHVNKPTLDICFVAVKYTDGGIDKGFDIFCHTAYRLCQKYDFIRFHVVGNFSEEDLVFNIPAEKITFYGLQYFDWFRDFYFDKDIIISPVRPYVLKKGAFDGFPTGGVIDAGLYEVLMISSDPLGDNQLAGFENWKDIVISGNNIYSIIQSIDKLIESPALIKSIAKAGREKILENFSEEKQIKERIKVITKFIS
ncbi:MAG TPA: hypothetical protein VFW07_15775 [Parafilimonas sp.]|nr:hypothetical protein [Parafilimonas sp.]